MKAILFLICARACFALPASGGSAPANEPVQIVSLENVVEENGKYHYSYESGNGIKARQEGELRVFDKENAGEVIQGEYQYQSPEGEQISVAYVADEHGYQPTGSHIPVPPPIPESISRALKYIAEHPYVEPERKKALVL